MRYKNGGDIQSKIDKLQSLIDSPNTPETDKANFRDALKKYKEKQKMEMPEKQEKPKPVSKPTATAKRKPVSKPTATAKPKPVSKPTATAKRKPVSKPTATAKRKPTAKPTATVKPKPIAKPTSPAKKTPKGIQMVSRKKVIIDGKEYNTDSKEFCDYLTDEFRKRREQAKQKKQTRKKTKSVMAQVTDKIESGIEKAIRTGVTTQKPILKKNPKIFIGKVEKLETATKNFLQQLKEVLGSEYDAKEITETTKAIQKMIDELKKKYSTKK